MGLVWVIAAMLVSATGTSLARRYAIRRRLLDEPGERRSHAVATPRGGGIGPVMACVCVLAFLGSAGSLAGADWRWILAALLSVALIGAWDDHAPLDARLRLGVHLLAGGALALGFGFWSQPLLAASVVFATAVLVNVWNFMDGINGIASTQAVIVLATGAALAPVPWVLPLLAFAAAVLAFVPFNFPKACIFLGDVGSGALGLLVLLPAGALVARDSGEAAALMLFPAAAFLSDATLTLFWRVVTGERWWTPHTRHLYQALARRHGHPRVTLAYAGWSVIGAGLAVAAAEAELDVTLIVVSLVLWYMATALVWARVQYRSIIRERARMMETDR